MSQVATPQLAEPETNERDEATPSTANVISASIPPSKIGESGNIWSRLLHATALPAIVGVAIFGVEGQFSMSIFKEAWPIMAVLAIAYVGAWRLSSEFERFPFVNQFEAAFVSVGVTLVPAGAALYSVPVSPVRNLALLASVGSIVWYLTDKFFCRYRASRLLLLPGQITQRLLSSPTVSKAKESPEKSLDGIVADFHTPMNGLQHFLASQSMKGLPVFHAGFVYELLTGKVLLETSCDRSVDIPKQRYYPSIARMLDIFLVLASLPVTVPVMALTAVAIYWESPGPVLFWQERVGKDGERFQMVKFRSMYLGNEGESKARYAQEEDDRVTRVGRWIRKFRIDELPQFWNVLKGEMSLIGPRPEQVCFARSFREDISLYPERHSVRPGISGWAQVRQGYAAGQEENRRKLEYDLYYVKHRSFVLDLLIIYLTLKTIFTGFGAR
jgi:lipopolysaccharide/colanic/teichoic acid biosynthesis glycosyltransferase